MKDMLLKKILLQRLMNLRLRDRSSNKTQNLEYEGFTLIELLVVIIIIGLLAAIALPSFLNQANKARFAEAKTYIGTMSRLQQAYYLEKRTFTNDVGKLNVGVNTSTSSFTYSAIAGDINGNPSPPVIAQLDQIITNAATPSSPNLKAVIAVVGIPGVVRIDTVFCIANAPNIAVIPPGSLDATLQTMKCPLAFSLE